MEYHLLEIIPSLEIITLSKILITFEIHFENFTFTSAYFMQYDISPPILQITGVSKEKTDVSWPHKVLKRP